MGIRIGNLTRARFHPILWIDFSAGLKINLYPMKMIIDAYGDGNIKYVTTIVMFGGQPLQRLKTSNVDLTLSYF